MIPQTMKKPVWLVPVCIVSLTFGLFLILLEITEMDQELQNRADRRGGGGFLLMVGVSNALLPIGALWWHTRASQREQPLALADDAER